jgi:D-glycero-D-manno-heptose 1,7-bisphosphate phosphatase
MRTLQNRFVNSDQIWVEQRSDVAALRGHSALFLDRDGVIVVERNYLWQVDDIEIYPDATEAIRRANSNDRAVVVVTNQAGIGRGYFNWEDFRLCNDEILKQLESNGAKVDLVIACPHHPNGKFPYAHPNHPMRKPNPGMFLAAAEQIGVDLGASLIIGDKASDLAAGRAAGLHQGVHVLTGHGGDDAERREALELQSSVFRVFQLAGIGDALSLPDLDGFFGD